MLNKISLLKVNGKVYNRKDNNVLIKINSNSLGDTIAAIPYIDKYRIDNNCSVSVKMNQKYELAQMMLHDQKTAESTYLYALDNKTIDELTEENDEVRGFVAQGLSECLQHARESGGRVQGGLSSNFNPPLVGIPSSVVVQMVLQLRDLLTGSVNRQISAHQTVREDPDCDEEM